MTQINPSLYIKPYGSVDRSDGWYVERSTNDLVAFVNGVEVSRIASGGSETITLADGYIFVGNASNVATAVAMSGDATIARTGAITVSDLTIASEARGDLLRRGASAWERVDAKTAGRFVMGDGTDVISQAISGDVATVASNGKVSLAENFRLRSAVSESTAGNVTHHLVDIKGGILLRDPNGANRTDVTDAASALVAGLNSPAAAGQFFDVVFVNTADADETITLTAGSGVTLSPTTIKIGRGQAAHLLFRADNVGSGTEAMTCYLLDDRLAAAQVLVGDSSGMPIPRTLSGAVTIDSTGVTSYNEKLVRENGGLSVGYVYFDGVGNPSDTETVTIDSRVYEFDNDASITGDVTVTIGANARATAVALAAAINGDATGVVHARKVDVGASGAIVELVPKTDVPNNYSIAEAATNVSVSAAAMVGGATDAHKYAHVYKYTTTAADEAVLTLQNGVILIAAVPSATAPSWFSVQRFNSSGMEETSANVFYTWEQVNANYYALQVLESQNGATDVNSGDVFYVMVTE